MRNDFLYRKLLNYFRSVIVAHEGCENEEYRVCCPFCKDSRHRLYINCAWGVYDPVKNSSNEHLVHCYNEFCVQPRNDEPSTQYERLRNRNDLFDSVYREMRGMASLVAPTVTQTVDVGPAEWPGRVIRLDQLAEVYPDHSAVKYLIRRGFDPVSLGRDYDFMFCDQVMESRYRMALDRIIMPIWKGDELYSWIGRYVGDEVNGLPLAKTGVKKYYNMPGRSLSRVGYNLDRVLCYSTIVVVEGVLDAVKTGPFATCLFTKSVPESLKKRILKGLQCYRDAVIVVMLDPDQSESERKRGVRHHIERVAESFRQSGSARVLPVYLPNGQDPGSMLQKDILREIHKAAKQQRIKLNFNQRRDHVPESTSDSLAGPSTTRPGFSKNVTNRRRPAVGGDVRETKNKNG